MIIDLTGKRALVGGSTQGIGKAGAFALANLGASVTLLARNREALEATCKGVKENVSRRTRSDLCGLRKHRFTQERA